MTLKKREKILALVSAALVSLLALYYLWPASESSLDELRKLRDDKQVELDKNKNKAMQAKSAGDMLADYQRRALPADQDTAHSLYQNWLRNLVYSANFTNVVFTAQPAQPLRDIASVKMTAAKNPGGAQAQQSNIYIRFSFNVQCQGTLEKLTQFLYSFYSAGHLHKLTSMNIKPGKNAGDLELNFTVEAMSLPTSEQKDKLSALSNKRLKLASVDEYKKSIVGRNIFAAYKPQRTRGGEGRRQDPPKIDPMQFIYLTAIIEAGGVPEAWLYGRTNGQTCIVHEGEEFTIDKVRGKVNRIGYNDIDIEIEGKSLTVGYGNSLKM